MKKFNINIKRLMLGLFIVSCLAVRVHAAKWESMTLGNNLQDDIKKLEDYCLLHDVKVSDVLWANNLTEQDLVPGMRIYLPKSQQDVLGLWQNQGAWQPKDKGLVQKASAAAAERARGSSGYKPKESAQTQANNNLPQVQVQNVLPQPQAINQNNLPQAQANNNLQAQAKKNNNSYMTAAEAEILAQLSNRPEPIKPKIKEPVQVNKNSQPEAEILAQISNRPEPIKPKVKDVKDNKDTGQGTEPVIILSPNGDSVNGPMRLVITDDGQVSVVKIPKSAAPRVPKMPDLDHPFGANLIANPVEPIPPYDPNKLYPRFQRNTTQAMIWPVDGKVSSPFGQRGSRRHTGIDIPMPPGTPIQVARDGVVAKTGNNSTMGFRGYGNFVLVDHGGGIKTLYAHCLNVNVKSGQQVRQGQIIATVGRTGRASTDHVHFEVRINDKPVNPMPYLENVKVASKK